MCRLAHTQGSKSGRGILPAACCGQGSGTWQRLMGQRCAGDRRPEPGTASASAAPLCGLPQGAGPQRGRA
eukprot:1141694-Pelagomonas_calceolata.AAC.2